MVSPLQVPRNLPLRRFSGDLDEHQHDYEPVAACMTGTGQACAWIVQQRPG